MSNQTLCVPAPYFDEPLIRLQRRPSPLQSSEFADLVERQLVLLGEDPARDGLQSTPARVTKAFAELTSGYGQTPESVLKNALFDVKSDEMVVVRDIEFYSLCEHHLLPFFGKCHIGYLPGRKVIGLSKLPRLVGVFSRRLQVQERLTTQIAEAILQHTGALGVGAVIEAQHLCMQMRGIQTQNSKTITSSMLGCFREDSRTRAEFLALVNVRGEIR
jgi:GTP cyclohydrolase IA